MLQPKRTKFRKQHKGKNNGIAVRGSSVSFGEFGLKAVTRGRLTARQIEAARRTISRHVKRGGKIWIRVFPDKPITEKPLAVRMGKGKGSVELGCSSSPWYHVIRNSRCFRRISSRSFYTGISEVAFENTIYCTDNNVMKLKASELRQKSRDELSALLIDLSRERFTLQMQKGTGQLSKTAQVKKVRRDVARVQTVLNEMARA